MSGPGFIISIILELVLLADGLYIFFNLDPGIKRLLYNKHQ